MKKFTDFSFNMFTEIVFGKDAEKKAGLKVKEHGGKKVMLVYGGGSIKKSGLYDTLTESLKKENIPLIELGGVMPNPRRSCMEKGLELAKKENVDFILGVGGASAIDTAKSIAMGLAYEGDVWDLYSGKANPERMAKLGAISTISAAGSETSGSSVLVDDINGTAKKSIKYSDAARPVFALMNPELTYTVSEYQTAVGAADIFSHTFERYFNNASSFLGEQFGVGVFKTVIKYASIALKYPRDYEARAELMLAASFSHNGVTGIGRAGEPFSVHGLESYISGKYDTAHGAGLAVLMPAWLEYVINNGGEEKQERAAQFAADVFGVAPDYQDIKGMAVEGVKRFRSWLDSIGMPLKLKELGIPESDIPDIVKNTRDLTTGYLGLDKRAVEAILRSVV